MKRFLALCIFGLCTYGLSAQQDAQYTQFMFNKLVLNPAYAGSLDAPCLTGIYRDQWLDIDGAPSTQSLSFQTPAFGNRVGLGVSLVRDAIGPFMRYDITAYYAYRIDVGGGKLSFGVDGSVRNLSFDSNELTPQQIGDPELPTGEPARYVPNFGLGAYYTNEKAYFGISVPSLLETSIDFTGASGSQVEITKTRQHAFAMAGFIMPVSSNVDFRPSLLVKYAKNSPLDLDANFSFVFFKKLMAGATVRFGGTQGSFAESIDAVLQYQISPQLRAGAAYDFTLSELNNYAGSSFEVMLEYCFKFDGSNIINPRFF